tara:strand:+ start:3370 stop:3804 length:435 start_codon:yes stop_codon:yes gene_type:complete
MAFNGNFLCTSFKVELMKGVHNFTAASDVFKVALYNNSATFTAATTAYTSTNEISGTNYTAKGNFLTSVTPVASGTTALTDFADEVFSNVTISAVRGALIYNEAVSGDPTVCVLDFGADKAASSGDFTIIFPTADASNAIIRIA